MLLVLYQVSVHDDVENIWFTLPNLFSNITSAYLIQTKGQSIFCPLLGYSTGIGIVCVPVVDL